MMLVNVCACFDVMISDHKSRVACKGAPPLFFLSFGTQLSFFFLLFSFLQCFWPCPFFFLHGPMLIWKSYNLNRFAKPVVHDATRSTRFCNNRESLPAWLSFFLQYVGQYRSKMIMMKNLSRKSFIEDATCTAVKGMITRGKKVSSVEGNEEYMEFVLLSSRLQHWVLVHFFQVLLTWLNPL